MTILVANGCSHTAGKDLERPNQKRCYKNAWPRWLAESMGWRFVNLAESGNSNEQIKRTTLNWIIKNVELEQNYKPEEVVVMIMWSGFDRFEMWNEKNNKFISCHAASMDINEESCLPELIKYVKYSLLVNNSSANEYKNLLNVYLTAKYLESLNIKYYFMNAISRWRTADEYDLKNLKDDYRHLLNAYGNRKDRHLGFHSLEQRFYQVMCDNNIPFTEHDITKTHYCIDGHKFWAKYVKDWITTIETN